MIFGLLKGDVLCEGMNYTQHGAFEWKILRREREMESDHVVARELCLNSPFVGTSTMSLPTRPRKRLHRRYYDHHRCRHVISVVFLMFLLCSAEAIGVIRRTREDRDGFLGSERETRRSERATTNDDLLENANHRFAEVQVKTENTVQAKFVFIAIAATSVVLSAGFMIWKHQYNKWILRADHETKERYEKELLKFTKQTEDLMTRMKEAMTNAFEADEATRVRLDEGLVRGAEQLMNIDGTHDIELARHEMDDTNAGEMNKASLRKEAKIAYTQFAGSLTYKVVRNTVLGVLGEELLSTGYNLAGSASAGVFLLYGIVTNVRKLIGLSKQLALSKLNRKFSTSNARSEGTKIWHHGKWAVCKIVASLYNDLELQTRSLDCSEESEARRENRAFDVACRFDAELRSIWSDTECEKFLSHEFVVGDQISWTGRGEHHDQTFMGKIVSIDPDGFYRVRSQGHEHKVWQHMIDEDGSGEIPPIGGNGVVTNLGVSSDCYARFGQHLGSDLRGYESWKMACTRRFDTPSSGGVDRICELHARHEPTNEMIMSLHCSTPHGECSDPAPEDDALREKCAKRVEECMKNAQSAADAAVAKLTRHPDCTNTDGFSVAFYHGRDKSRAIVFEQTSPAQRKHLAHRAVYELDLHALFVPKRSTWIGALVNPLLGLPGWVTRDKAPISASLVPLTIRRIYRATKRYSSPNPNLDAIALLRGVDFEIMHYLAPRWSVRDGDVKYEYERERCGETGEMAVITRNVDLRWLSACADDGDGHHSNQFRKSFQHALERHQEKGDGSISYAAHVGTKDKRGELLGTELLIFWQHEETAPSYLPSWLKDKPGPCFLIATVTVESFGKTGRDGVKTYHRKARIDHVPDVCGSFNAKTGQIVNAESGHGDIYVPYHEAPRWREAALVAQTTLMCKKSVFPFQAWGNWECHGRGRLAKIRRRRSRMTLRVSAQSPHIAGEGSHLWSNSRYERHGSVGFGKGTDPEDPKEWVDHHTVTFTVPFSETCESWIEDCPDECIYAAFSDGADEIDESDRSHEMKGGTESTGGDEVEAHDVEDILGETEGEDIPDPQTVSRCQAAKDDWERRCQNGDEREDHATEVIMYPAGVVVAAILCDDMVSRGADVDTTLGMTTRSKLLSTQCDMNSLPSLDAVGYRECVSGFLAEPNVNVDDRPGWTEVSKANSVRKIIGRHEVLPDLRYNGPTADASLYAFFARKTEATVDQPPVSDIRLTMSEDDVPSESCRFDTSCSDDGCLTPVISDESRYRCDWWRVTTSLGDGTHSERRHLQFIWTKRRFALDPCEVSEALDGWVTRGGGEFKGREKRKTWCERASRGAVEQEDGDEGSSLDEQHPEDIVL